MKQEQHNIDKLFNQSFQNFEPSVPPPVWDKVQTQMQQRKRRRLIPIFWFCSLIGVGSVCYYLGNNQSDENSFAKNTEVINQAPQAIVSSTKEAIAIKENSFSEQQSLSNINIISDKEAKKQISKYDNKIFSSNSVDNLESEAKIAITTSSLIRQNIAISPLDVLFPQPLNWDNKIQLKKNQKEDCYTFHKKNWESVAIEAYIGGSYVQPIFSIKSNEPNKYETVRDSSEKYVLAGDAGVWFNPIHRSGIGIRTGIHASRWVEKLSLVNAYEEKYQMIVTQVKDNQGNVIKKDTSFGWVRGRLVQKYYNHYTTLNIPLQIGFEYLKPSRTQYFAYAGAMLNLRFWSKGEIFDTADKIISFPAPNKVFETNIGVSLIGHIGMRHRLSEHWWLTESLQCNYTMNSITSKVHPLEQRNINAGVQVGLRYKF